MENMLIEVHRYIICDSLKKGKINSDRKKPFILYIIWITLKNIL